MDDERADGRSSSTGWNRRRILRTAGAVGAATAGGLASTGVAAADRELWRANVTDSRSIWNSPSVVDGTVYLPHHRKLRAFDATTGEEIIEDPESSSRLHGESAPEVADGRVFDARSGDVCAFDAETGDRLWWTEIDEHGRGSPIVDGGTVYALGGSTNYDAFEDEPTLHALEAATGDHEWEVDLHSEGNGGSSDTSPTLVDGVLYADVGNVVTAVDVEDGTQYWTTEVSNVNVSPTVADGTVVVGTYWEYCYGLDAETGEELWQFDGMDDEIVTAHPTAADGTVYLGSNDGHVYAVDLESGDQEWRFETGTVYSGPTVVGDTVFVTSYFGEVYAVDRTSGEERWTYDLGEDIGSSSPVVVDGTLYVGTDEGTLLALDAGQSGSSDGSRVLLGTHNHHDELERGRESLDPVQSEDLADGAEDDGSEANSDTGDGGNESDGSESGDDGSDDGEDGSQDGDGDGGGGDDGDESEADGDGDESGDGDERGDANGETEDENDGSSEGDDGDADTDVTETAEEEGSDDDLPGFGFGAAVTGLAGAGYALRSRSTDEGGDT